MERNYIIALVLMTIVIAAWMFFIIPRNAQKAERVIEEKTSESQVREKETGLSEEKIAEDSDVDIAEDETDVAEKVVGLGNKVVVDTGYYQAEFSEGKAIATSWELKKYKRRDDKNKLINLIPVFARNCLNIKFIDSSLQLDAIDSIWVADKSELTFGDNSRSKTITFKSQIGNNLELSKKFTFYNNSYIVDLDISFHNKSTDKLTALSTKDESGESGYMLRWGHGMPADLLPGGKSKKRRGGHNGAKALTLENKIKEKLKEEEVGTIVKWVAFENQYFMASMIPEPDLEPRYKRETFGDEKSGEEGIAAGNEAVSMMIPGFMLGSNQTRTNHFRLYVGPKNNDMLKKVTIPISEEPAKLNEAIDFGFFGPVSLVMLWLINAFYKVTRNYGISIILLVIVVKAVVYPLTRKSYKSMKKMKELQPKIAELQEKYRDDPKKLNKATMRFYKEEGVNPMGGCIPFLPQMPILFALFSAIRNSIELRGAGFVRYLASDLSAPSDAIFTIPGLGFIPFLGTPAGLPIRLLPLIYMGATFLQQKITGNVAAGAGSQNKLMKFMPLMFGFIFYDFESGLVLYWLCNMILTTTEQYIVNKGSSQLPPPKGGGLG